MSSSSPTGSSLSPFPSGRSLSRSPSPIRDTFDRIRNHVGRSRSSSSGSNLEGPTSNWLVNMGWVAGTPGGAKVHYKSNRPHGGFGNLLVSIGNHAASIASSHHLRRGSSSQPQVTLTDHETQKSVETLHSLESYYSTCDIPHDIPHDINSSRSRTRRGSAASEESYPGARLFVRQLSAYLAQDESDRDSLFICEHPNVLEHNVADDLDFNILSIDDEATLEGLGFFNFGREAPSSKTAYDEYPPIQNIVDITAYTVDASTPSLRMRALLDTGSMGPNMMASSLAKLTGHPIEELPEGFSYSPRVGNGQTLAPEGLVRVRWYFSERFSQAKSYDILFLVVPDTVMFDVVLGFKFLQAEHIFTMPSLFAMTGGQFVHDSTEAERRRTEEAVRRRREEQTRRRREEERRRRDEARRRREAQLGR